MASIINHKKLLIEISAELGVPIYESAIIPASAIIFSPELLDCCKTNVCGNYNKSWTCPPVCGNFEEQKAKIISYQNVLVFTTMHKLEDSFDCEGMEEGRKLHSALTIEIKKRMGGAPIFGAGGCPVCADKRRISSVTNEAYAPEAAKTVCAYPAACPFPDEKISSIEAAGINVTELSKTAKINYNNGRNTVTFFSMLLLDK